MTPYRQCGVLPYTNDIDFAAPITDYTPAVMRAVKWMTKMGLVCASWHMCACVQTSDSLELRARVRGVLVDLFFIYADTKNNTSSGSWVGGIDVNNGNKYR
jgi:hypothetical protein